MPTKKTENLDVLSMSTDQLAAYRRKLAKRANQRIVRLDQAEIDPKSTAYGAYAKRYLDRMGRNRFAEKKSAMSRQQELAEVAQLHRFLNAKSSTVAGYKAIRKKATKTLQKKLGEKYGAKIDAQFLDNFMRQHFAMLKNAFGYQAAFAVASAAGDSNITKEELIARLQEVSDLPVEDLQDLTIEELFDMLGLKYNKKYDQPLDMPEENPFR